MSEALDFLRQWSPTGNWILTSIEPDRMTIATKTFSEKTADELENWLELYNEKRNIYFHVNSCRTELSKKAERQDIKSLDWLHVDIDPRPNEDIKSEQKRALDMLLNPPGNLPKPTCIIFSGGGYQGFWKLEEPFTIEGELALAEKAKLYNMQLEIMFGADNCHNVDRIMRLPGTMNIPSKKKKTAGRKPTKAKVIEFDNTRLYKLGENGLNPVAQATSYYSDAGFAGSTVQISGNIERITSVDELPESVSDNMKVLIVQGKDPDEPNKYPSRSEALFAVCCALVRAGMSDDKIFGVITDSNFGIATSIIEKGSKAESYAKRQIERARENAIDPNLRIMN